MNKISIVASAMMLSASSAFAGGLMTNTNYHIAFDRMMARGASFDIDAAYSNPAGLAWGHDGFQLSLNFQKPWQNRDIETNIPNFLAYPGVYNGYNGFENKKFEGKASAPIVPALFASYKKDKIAVSAMIGIVGSGGFVEYKEGVPMFNSLVMGSIFEQTLKAYGATHVVTPDMYTIDSNVKGKQYIYGGQVNFTYKFTDYLAAAVGVRANYYDGYSRVNLTATTHNGQTLADMKLDCTQRGWGFAPIVSLDYHQGPVTVAARYEFRTKINTKNDTKEIPAQLVAERPDLVAPYLDGNHVRYDMPSLLSVAVGYEFTPSLRATAEYHFFDDKNAKMAGDRQKALEGGTNEYLLGLEYDINEKFTISCGGQRTDYGLSDDYQQHTSFACDSYSVGLGGAWNINDKVRLNAGYFVTLYTDYTKEYTADKGGYMGTGFPGTDTFSRTNHVIGIGIDYKF